jgi:mRNA interferase RelE/StbE
LFKIFFSKKASKSIKILPKANRERLKEIILSLKENPFNYPYKKIQGEVNLYRIRLGKYRILYEVKGDQSEIIILKVELRKKVYD